MGYPFKSHYVSYSHSEGLLGLQGLHGHGILSALSRKDCQNTREKS